MTAQTNVCVCVCVCVYQSGQQGLLSKCTDLEVRPVYRAL